MPSVGNETNHVIDGLTIRGGLALEGDAGAKTYLNRDTASASARAQIMARSLGYFSETYQRGSTPTSGLMSDGTVYFCGIPLLAGDVVSTMISTCTVAASGATIAKMGLYTLGGTLLASCADQSVAFGSSGNKSAAMTTPYLVTTDGMYYAAIFAKVSTTMPTIARSGISNNAIANAVTGATAICGVLTGQTDLPASATISVAANTGLHFWLAVA